jgi:hypothetical protein
MSPVLVPLEELAVQLGGGTAETAAARLALAGQTPVEDWQGRLAVPVEVAEKAITAYRRDVEDAEARRAAYDVYLAEREARRHRAGEVAAQKAMDATHDGELQHQQETYAGFVGQVPADNAHTRVAGREARREALIAFDAKHPLTPFEKFKGGGKK